MFEVRVQWRDVPESSEVFDSEENALAYVKDVQNFEEFLDYELTCDGLSLVYFDDGDWWLESD